MPRKGKRLLEKIDNKTKCRRHKSSLVLVSCLRIFFITFFSLYQSIIPIGTNPNNFVVRLFYSFQISTGSNAYQKLVVNFIVNYKIIIAF